MRQPDISAPEKFLAGSRKVDFDEGIAQTIEYFRTWLERSAVR